MANLSKPVVIITGCAGQVGSTLIKRLKKEYHIVGWDQPNTSCDIEVDITNSASVEQAVAEQRKKYGKKVAAVVHLAAFFDFSGKESPLYDQVNVQGTRNLLKALQALEVERFIYSGTMLVHAPCQRGELISEEDPIDPRWAYPESKAKTEEIIRKHHGDIPYTILRLAGLYDEASGVPTLTHQIARIYEEDLKSYLYAGDEKAGQAFIHQEDMVDLFKRTIDRRTELPKDAAILAGEPEVMSYEALQETIGKLIHGDEHWQTISLPKPLAKAGAWAEEQTEPAIPDALDEGERPFIKPFMIEMASDHYALDIRKARTLLGWEPQHRIADHLPDLVKSLKKDPADWYDKNDILPPHWLRAAEEKGKQPEKIRTAYEKEYETSHRQHLWASFLAIGLGGWLITSPMTMGYESSWLSWSDMLCGLLVALMGQMSLSSGKWLRMARFGNAAIGLWLLFAPLIFWAPTAAAYVNDTIIGTLIIGLSVVVRPFPAMSPTAAMTGPEVPPGWDFSPSSWFQRMPVILMAFIGFFISRYMTAYQLGHIDAVWDPFFTGAIPGDQKNGTEEIITSHVSEAWPVPDAGLGALTYLLEILTGLIGSTRRWRTMPWLVLLFGFMIIPLGVISITFIIIQPIMLGTWCTLCLMAAMAMLIQVPYSFDEIVATIEFLRRRHRKGHPWMKILFTGDTDDGTTQERQEDDFKQSPWAILHDVITGGLTVPWNLAGCLLIGLWLMFTRVTLGAEDGMANADHLIGALVITVTVTAFAEVVRALRFLNMFLGAALLITPFVYGASPIAIAASIACGLGLMVLSYRRGPIRSRWGEWQSVIM